MTGLVQGARIGAEFMWNHSEFQWLRNGVASGVATVLETAASHYVKFQASSKLDEKDKLKLLAPTPLFDYTEDQVAEIQARLDKVDATPEEMRREIELSGRNISAMGCMRLIDGFIMGERFPEGAYLSYISEATSSTNLRRRYFQHIDDSGAFFITKWIAKLAYMILFPFISNALQSGGQAVFEDIDSLLKNWKAKGINQFVGEAMEGSNEDLRAWIEAFKQASLNRDVNKSLPIALEEELIKAKYHRDMPPEAFFEQMTDKLVDTYFSGFSLSKAVFNGFQLSGKALWRKLINILLFPLAAVMYLLFLVPQMILNKVLTRALKNYMKNEKVLENLVEKMIGAVSSNKGLTVPALEVVIEGLEEILLEMQQGIFEDVEEEVANLDPWSKRQLKENVGLIEDAVHLYSSHTVEELGENLKSTPGKQQYSKTKLVAEQVAAGVGEVLFIAHKRLSNPIYVKERLWRILHSLNESFLEPPEKDEDRQRKLDGLQDKFKDLLKRILSVSIGRNIQNKYAKGYIRDKGMFQKLLSSRILDMVFPQVSASINMSLNSQFLTFVFMRKLAQFADSE